MNTAAIEAAFQSAIAATGLAPPDTVHADGLLHRYSANGRRGDTSAWYVLHLDGVPAGVFGCWRAGLHSTWCGKPMDSLSEAERSAHRERIRAMRAQRDTEEAQRLRSEADRAALRWSAASPNCQHPYLAAKGVQPHGLRQDGAVLLVPLRDTAGQLHSLQTIDAAGDKRYRGRKKGCYHAMGRPQGGVLIVGEGYATCASIHEATGHAVEVLQTLVRKNDVHLNTPSGKIEGEQSMWAEVAETNTVINTREIFPGLYVAGMAANASYGSYRMGPIFGGMLLSGEKVAADIAAKLRG